MDLKNKVAIITGASSGIGEATAHETDFRFWIVNRLVCSPDANKSVAIILELTQNLLVNN